MNNRLRYPLNYELRALALRFLAAAMLVLLACGTWHVWHGAQRNGPPGREAATWSPEGFADPGTQWTQPSPQQHRGDSRAARAPAHSVVTPETRGGPAPVRTGNPARANVTAAGMDSVRDQHPAAVAAFTTRVDARGGYEDARQQHVDVESIDDGRGDANVGRRDVQDAAEDRVGEAVQKQRVRRSVRGGGVGARSAAGREHLALARVCFLESGFRTADCAAIHHVIVTRSARAAVPYLAMLRRYSAIDAANPRARWVRTLPDGDSPDRGEAWNRHWRRLRAHAAAVLRGEVVSGCRADHWGSKSIAVDVERAKRAIDAGRWRRARCKGTVNAFYVTTAFKGARR